MNVKKLGFLGGLGATAVLLAGNLSNAFAGEAVKVDTPADKTHVELQDVKQVNLGQELSSLSRREALLASSDLKVVLHYGEGIYFADVAAEALVEANNLDATAYSGGKPNQIELFVNRKLKGVYTQDDLNGGTLGSLAVVFFEKEYVEWNNKRRKEEKGPQND